MHLNRLRLGEITALVGAVLLVVSLFLDWARADVPGGAAESGFSAAGIVVVALLLLVAALALTLVVLTVTVEPVGLTISAAVATAFFGVLVSIVTLVRVLLFQPDLGVGLGNTQVTMQLGAYLSLLGVVLCAAGGWITMKDERTDAPYSAAPDLEPRPAPPAEVGGPAA